MADPNFDQRPPRDVGLGGLSTVTLADARKAATAIREAVAVGRDPLAEKRQREATPTFRDAALRVFEANRPSWRNGKHQGQWIKTLELYAFPTLGDCKVDAITRSDVLRVLTPIWSAKPETARRVRQRIRATLRWAMAHGFVETNMAGEAIDGALPTMRLAKRSHPAVPYADLAEVMAQIEDSRAWPCTVHAIHFAILTAARSG